MVIITLHDHETTSCIIKDIYIWAKVQLCIQAINTLSVCSTSSILLFMLLQGVKPFAWESLPQR